MGREPEVRGFLLRVAGYPGGKSFWFADSRGPKKPGCTATATDPEPRSGSSLSLLAPSPVGVLVCCCRSNPLGNPLESELIRSSKKR